METSLLYNLPFANKWASEKIKGSGGFPEDTGNIALMKNGKIVAVCVYTQYTGTGVMMNIASDGTKRWMTKQFLRACFEWPFNYLKCRRVTGLVRADQPEVMAFDEHLGFKREGIIREGEEDGTDLILYCMLKSECRWIR